MEAAFKILGYNGPICHGFNMNVHLQDINMWDEGLKIKFSSNKDSSKERLFGRKEFDNLLGDYEIVSDFPPLAFCPELIAAYPEAKVIIVEREIEAWYRSFDKTLIQNIFNPIAIFVCNLDEKLGRFSQMTRTMLHGYFKATTKEELQANSREVYRNHYETIRRITPKERLLDFKLEQGWKPLCEFLGKGIPDVPFPRINEAAEFQEKSNIMVKIAAKRVLKRWRGYGVYGFGAAALGIILYRFI